MTTFERQQQREQIEHYNLLIKQIEDRIVLCRDRETMVKFFDGRTSLVARRDELLRLHGPLPTPPKPVTAESKPASLPKPQARPQDDTPAPRTPAKVFSFPKRVKVHSVIANAFAAPKYKRAPIGAAWYLLRAWDIENQNGRGKIARGRARDLLTGMGKWGHLSRRRLRQILRQGQGVTWDIDTDYIWLYAPWRVAKALDIGRLRSDPVWVNTSDLARGVKRARAQFYTAAFNATRDASPITRTSLQAITGVSPRTQQDYDKLTKTAVQRNIAVTPHKWSDDHARELLSWQRGKSLFCFIDWAGKHEKKGTKWLAYGLPNSYVSAFEHAPRGRQKKHNKRIDLVKRMEPGNDDSIVRIYHPSGKKAAKAFDRDSEHDHYWQGKRSNQPTAKNRARLTGVNVWHVLSLQGVNCA